MSLLRRFSTPVLLFLFFFSLYTLTTSGRIQYGDEIEKYRVAQSIVERGDFSFRPTAVRNFTDASGRTYSIYELGQTVLEIPLYAAARVVNALVVQPDPNWTPFLFVGLLNPLLTALTCVVLFLTCRVLGYDERIALLLTLVFGFATIAWAYSKGYTREPVLAFLTLLSLYLVFRFQEAHRLGWLLAAGLATGYLVFTKFIHAMVVPVLVAYIVLLVYQRRSGESRRTTAMAALKALAIFLLPAIVFLLIQSVYALVRFRSPLQGLGGTPGNPLQWIFDLVAQSHPDRALVALLASPEKSIFLYSPPILLSPIAWLAWVRVRRREALLFLVLIVVEFISVISRPDWDGGSWWGPRYLVQITALLVIPLGILGSARGWLRWLWRIVLPVLFVAGVLVQLVALSANTRDYLDITGTLISLAGQLDFLRHGFFDSLVLYLSPGAIPVSLNPFAVLNLSLVVLLGALMVVVTLGPARGLIQRPPSARLSLALGATVLLIQLAAFLAWIVTPLPTIHARQGDTRLRAADRFLADGRVREARALYLSALQYGTSGSNQALAHLEQLAPHPVGDPYTAEDLAFQTHLPPLATARRDDKMTLSGQGALRISLPAQDDASVQTEWIATTPNTTYRLSGWIRVEGIYGSGYAVIALYEDNGAWNKARGTTVTLADETSGWQPFEKTITTLPTTRRMYISAGLWQTFGTLWIDGVELAQVH